MAEWHHGAGALRKVCDFLPLPSHASPATDNTWSAGGLLAPSKSKVSGNKRRGCLGGSVGGASDFGSGHDLAVHGFEPHIGLCVDSLEPAPGSLSPFLYPPLPRSLSLSLPLSKINKC